MRSFKWAVAAFALGGLSGCGLLGNSDPELFRVALAAAPDPLPSTCYEGGQAPNTPRDEQTNTVAEQQWVLWDGLDGVKYLDVGNQVEANMAQAPDVELGVDAIEGKENDDGKYVFTAERTDRDTDRTIVTRATYTFEDIGQTVEGTLTVFSSCAGTACGTNRQLTCEYSRRFVGRRIDGDRLTVAGDVNP